MNTEKTWLKWLKQNPMLKLLSLVLAFIIWLTVVNFSNPDVKDNVNVELKVLNGDRLTEADKIYSLSTKSVRINYTVRTKYRSQVTAEDFEAYIDLKDYSITGAVPVYIEVSGKASGMISGVTPNPMVVHVTTEDLQEKRFDIKISTTGKQAENHVVAEGSVNPGHVDITGPVSEIGQISSVGIEVDVSGQSTTVAGDDAKLIYYDANNNPITVDSRVRANHDTISYQLPIYKIKSLSITAGTVGTPAEGYAFESVDMNPGFVDVYGPDEILKNHVSIAIPDTELDITGAVRNVTKSVNITPYIPEGLKLAQPGAEVAVVAKIIKLPETTEESETAEETKPQNAPGTSEETEETTREHVTETEETTEEAETESTAKGPGTGEAELQTQTGEAAGQTNE